LRRGRGRLTIGSFRRGGFGGSAGLRGERWGRGGGRWCRAGIRRIRDWELMVGRGIQFLGWEAFEQVVEDVEVSLAFELGD
jgi:hypothetical protein